jgi:sugar lactone lactonase YvrE
LYEFDEPVDVHVARRRSHTRYVLDKGNNRVREITAGATAGTIVAGGNGAGAGLGQLDGPSGLTVDDSGNIFIADTNNHRAVQWAPDMAQGYWVAGHGGQGSAQNQLDSPADVVVDSSGDIYVADTMNDRVMKYTKLSGYYGNPIPCAGFGGTGPADNQLDGPTSLALDEDLVLTIADTNNHRVVEYQSGATEGTVVAGGNGQGSGPDQLDSPRGVEMDADGALFVSDTNNHRVVKYTPGAAVGEVVAGVGASPTRQGKECIAHAPTKHVEKV